MKGIKICNQDIESLLFSYESRNIYGKNATNKRNP